MGNQLTSMERTVELRKQEVDKYKREAEQSKTVLKKIGERYKQKKMEQLKPSTNAENKGHVIRFRRDSSSQIVQNLAAPRSSSRMSEATAR
jgi:hypothetical protein